MYVGAFIFCSANLSFDLSVSCLYHICFLQLWRFYNIKLCFMVCHNLPQACPKWLTNLCQEWLFKLQLFAFWGDYLSMNFQIEHQKFVLESWQRSLNALTWTEILRQVLVAAGFCSKVDTLHRDALNKVLKLLRTFSWLLLVYSIRVHSL